MDSLRGAPAPEDPAPKTLAGRASFAMVLLLLTIPANLWVIVADLDYLDFLNRLIDGEALSIAEARDAEDVVQASGLIYFFTSLGATAAFLFWFARAYYNLPRLGLADLRWGRGWSIGAWFVPILNLIRPKRIANDVWRGSEGPSATGHRDWHSRPVDRLVHWWWAAWIVSGVVGWLFTRILLSGDEPTTQAELLDLARDERLAYFVDIASSLLLIPAAILAVLFVRRVTDRQERAIAARKAAGP
jgi:hypothetical protein